MGNRPATAALLKNLAPTWATFTASTISSSFSPPPCSAKCWTRSPARATLLTEVAALYRAGARASAELEELDRTAQEKLRLADLWGFQRKEIEAVAPQPGEDAELENERRVLRNVVRLQESAGAAYAALIRRPAQRAAQLRTVAKRLEEVARNDDESIREVIAALQPASIAVDEAAHALRHYLGELEADPAASG